MWIFCNWDRPFCGIEGNCSLFKLHLTTRWRFTNKHIAGKNFVLKRLWHTCFFYTHLKICFYIDSESKDEPSKPYLSPDFLNVVSPAPTGVFFYFACVSLFTFTWYCTVYKHAVTFTFYKVSFSVITATSTSPTWYLLIPVSPEILNSL